MTATALRPLRLLTDAKRDVIDSHHEIAASSANPDVAARHLAKADEVEAAGYWDAEHAHPYADGYPAGAVEAFIARERAEWEALTLAG